MTSPSTGSLATTEFGGTGLQITRVGLGSWAIGGQWRWGWGRQDDEQSIATILAAVERGVNWIDTAAVYGFGHSEEIIAAALQRLPAEQRPLVFTKCGIEQEADGEEVEAIGHPAAIRRGAEESLKRLGVDVIDLLQLHWPPADGNLEDAWSTLVELRTEGKIRFAGLSNCDADQLERAERIGRVDTLQPPLSLVERAARRGPLPWCTEHGTGVIVYSPMGAGLLTGRLDAAAIERLDPDDWRRADEGFSGEPLARTLALVEQLRAIADDLECSLPELAVAWTLHQPAVSGAIVGARRPDQVEGWIKGGEVGLDGPMLERIEAAIAETGAGNE
jgi:aryl-alcohol dehydrogenase-like predicted oxidoreductase